jgi:hypothetical protein
MPDGIGRWRPPPPQRRDLADPALMRRDFGQLAYTWVEGQLYIEGATASDVRQGNLDNCYFLATLAAAAHQRPDVLNNALRDQGDGTYALRLYEKKWGGTREKWHTFDGQLPTRFGVIQEYGRSARHDELWVGLFEKGFAAAKGGYERIGNLGRAADALFALTGRKADLVRVDGRRTEADLAQRLSRGQLIVAASHDDPRKLAGTGLRQSHSYAVLGVADGHVLLHDPVGAQPPYAHGDSEGGLKVPLEVFARTFQSYNAA